MQAAHVRINSGKDRPVVALFLMRNYQRLVTHFFRMYKVFFGKRIIFSHQYAKTIFKRQRNGFISGMLRFAVD